MGAGWWVALYVNASYLTYFEAFKPDELKIVLTDKDANEMEWITGKGQMVYWEDCKITFFVKDDNGKRDEGQKCTKTTGQIEVPASIDLFCSGGKLRQS